MRYRTMGNSGTVVSVQTLGTMTFGREADEQTSGQILTAFLEAGGTFVDTADVYGGGASEEILGRWLQAHPTEAASVVLATKGRFTRDFIEPNALGASRRHLSRALEASLKRLQTDHVDLYQVHAYDALTPQEETLRFLDDAVTAGTIGHYGFSNYTGWQLTKAAHVARQHRLAPPVTLQPQYSLLVRGIEHEIVPAALDERIGLLPWSPLAGGWLTGKYERGSQAAEGSRFADRPAAGAETWAVHADDDHTWAVVDAVREVAEQADSTPASVALAWVDAQPGVTSTILGARTVDQLRQNLAAVDLALTPEQLARLTEVSAPRTEVYPYGPIGEGQRRRPIAPR